MKQAEKSPRSKQQPAVRKKKRTDSSKKKVQIRKQRQREREKQRKKKQRQTLFKEIGLTLLLFSLLFTLVQQVTFSLPKVSGYSMMPTITDGDRLLVNKLGTIKRFSLVYYRDPKSKETSIRRVVGLPNERLTYRSDQLYINDQEVVERFLEEAKEQAKANETQITEDFTLSEVLQTDVIPEESYFVLGDNRSYASDSRDFGTIKRKDIIGTVEMRWLPFHRLSRF